MDLKYLCAHWDDVRARLIETVDRFREDELDFKPFPASWPVRELMLHVAHEEYGEFHYGIAQTLNEFPPPFLSQDYPTLASIKTLLDHVHAPIRAELNNLQPSDLERVIVTPWGPQYRLIEMLGHLLEHEIHHRAELSLILGLLGRQGLDA